MCAFHIFHHKNFYDFLWFLHNFRDLEGSGIFLMHSFFLFLIIILKLYITLLSLFLLSQNDTLLSMLNKILRLFSSSSSSGSHHFIYFKFTFRLAKKKKKLMRRKEWVRCVWGYLLIKSTSSHNLLLRKFPLALEKGIKS